MDVINVKIRIKDYKDMNEWCDVLVQEPNKKNAVRIIGFGTDRTSKYSFLENDKVLYEPTEEQRKVGYIHFVRWNGKEISENDKYNLYQIIDDIEEGTYLLKVKDEE